MNFQFSVGVWLYTPHQGLAATVLYNSLSLIYLQLCLGLHAIVWNYDLPRHQIA
jgi:hypothetical protein